MPKVEMGKKRTAKGKSSKIMTVKQLEAMINKHLKKTRKNKKDDKIGKGFSIAADAAWVGKFLGEMAK